MSFDLPVTIEPEVIQYAQTEHITEREAIERLIRAGLNAQPHQAIRAKTPGEEMIGAFSSAEDIAIIDEAMQHVREMRATNHFTYIQKAGYSLHLENWRNP